jgi:predicted permease
LAAFILLLETLGFLLSIALLTAFLLRVVEREGWLTTLVAAVGNAGALYIVFKVLLGVSLPKNAFGF